jgi:hypothetical protein
MLVCQVCGVKPWGHHLTNVVLHALNAALVFAVLQRMTGARWRSLLVAGLFALHPLRLESVAWVSERKDVLSGFFGLLALLAYARYAEGRGEKAESRKQKAESRNRQAVVCGPWSVHPPQCRYGGRAVSLPSSIFHLLSSIPVLVRPGLDEQADAGDVAVRAAAPGLLAFGENAEENAERRMQNAECSIQRHVHPPQCYGGRAPRTTRPP